MQLQPLWTQIPVGLDVFARTMGSEAVRVLGHSHGTRHHEWNVLTILWPGTVVTLKDAKTVVAA